MPQQIPQQKDKTSSATTDIDQEYFLQNTILQTDFLCDAASLLSPRSTKSQFLVGTFGSEHLELLVPVTKIDHLDQKPMSPAIPYPMYRADLESNLALMYTIQMHHPLSPAPKLQEERDELLRRSEKRFNDLGCEYGTVKGLYYKAMAAYFPAACSAMQIKAKTQQETEEMCKLLTQAINLFEQTAQKAKEYHELYHTFALYNLGRSHFTLGQKELAQTYFNQAKQTPLIKRIERVEKHYVNQLINWHLENIDSSFCGVVLPDQEKIEEKVRTEIKNVFVGIYGGGNIGEELFKYRIETQYMI